MFEWYRDEEWKRNMMQKACYCGAISRSLMVGIVALERSLVTRASALGPTVPRHNCQVTHGHGSFCSQRWSPPTLQITFFVKVICLRIGAMICFQTRKIPGDAPLSSNSHQQDYYISPKYTYVLYIYTHYVLYPLWEGEHLKRYPPFWSQGMALACAM